MKLPLWKTAWSVWILHIVVCFWSVLLSAYDLYFTNSLLSDLLSALTLLVPSGGRQTIVTGYRTSVIKRRVVVNMAYFRILIARSTVSIINMQFDKASWGVFDTFHRLSRNYITSYCSIDTNWSAGLWLNRVDSLCSMASFVNNYKTCLDCFKHSTYMILRQAFDLKNWMKCWFTHF